ncbi:hypothetical protein LUZ60_006843 [Juncus effusus]|nr:hypothetical protein LUZ60_006843 [Juncus effusus]
MAVTTSSVLPLRLSHRSASRRLTPVFSSLPGRRQSLLLLLSLPAPFLAATSPSYAKDIPLFGIRKRLENIEQEAVEVVKEGEETVEKGIEAAEMEIESAGAGLAVAGDLVQAGVVAGAEAVAVLAAVSVVNGILSTEKQ